MYNELLKRPKWFLINLLKGEIPILQKEKDTIIFNRGMIISHHTRRSTNCLAWGSRSRLEYLSISFYLSLPSCESFKYYYEADYRYPSCNVFSVYWWYHSLISVVLQWERKRQWWCLPPMETIIIRFMTDYTTGNSWRGGSSLSSTHK